MGLSEAPTRAGALNAPRTAGEIDQGGWSVNHGQAPARITPHRHHAGRQGWLVGAMKAPGKQDWTGRALKV
jgi:hypothetical protein